MASGRAKIKDYTISEFAYKVNHAQSREARRNLSIAADSERAAENAGQRLRDISKSAGDTAPNQ